MVLATEDLSVLLIDADTLHHLLEVQPRVAQDIGEVIEVRRRAIRALAL
jgi:CRP-like cAMP-binding protein